MSLVCYVLFYVTYEIFNKINVLVGIPDERLGEEVAAFVRLRDESKHLGKNEIQEFCKGKLAHFKIPRHVFVVDDYPRTLSGKIQKFKFLDEFGHLLNVGQKKGKKEAKN